MNRFELLRNPKLAREIEDNYMVGSVRIQVPNKLFNITKTGNIQLVDTLTKTGNIATRDKKKVIELVPGDEAKILSKGQTMTQMKADYARNKTKKNIGELIENIDKTKIDSINKSEEIPNLISGIEKELESRKTKPEIKPEIKSGKYDLVQFNNDLFKIIDEMFKIKKNSPYKYDYNKDRLIKRWIDIYDKGLNAGIVKTKHDRKFFENLFENVTKNLNDYFPTPRNLFDDNYLQEIIKRAEAIFEPTAGTGHIINAVRDINPEAEIIANEMNPVFSQLLGTYNPDIKTYTKDFLKDDIIQPFYDLTIINPPFTYGGDSRYYMRFLFRCLYWLNQTKGIYQPGIIFISPQIASLKKGELNEGETFELSNIINYLSNANLKRILEDYNIKVTDKEIKDYREGNGEELEEKINDLFDFAQGQLIKKSFKGFGGTGASANVYYIIGFQK